MFGSSPFDHASKEVVMKYQKPDDWRSSCKELLRDCSAIFGELPFEERIQRLCIMSGAPKIAHNNSPISREAAAHNALHMRRLLEITNIFDEEAANTSDDEKSAMNDSLLGRGKFRSGQLRRAGNDAACTFLCTRHGCDRTTLRSCPSLSRSRTPQKNRTSVTNVKPTGRALEEFHLCQDCGNNHRH